MEKAGRRRIRKVKVSFALSVRTPQLASVCPSDGLTLCLDQEYDDEEEDGDDGHFGTGAPLHRPAGALLTEPSGRRSLICFEVAGKSSP